MSRTFVLILKVYCNKTHNSKIFLIKYNFDLYLYIKIEYIRPQTDK